ncbi:hypothetical protein [Lutispora thermophila]|uniref:Uncharacterized protein n=1 Tax=Lutispora thermophila DSM 19022 TaxID=1122184 RepID=A0A1M6F1E2_9FIRM|nr:hypothetical protein [Lutispora thermophila]SHI91500.1 hypothetical protein SAMN02745176_01767 [Lutispora thermophila DSM 19022]
MPLPQVECTGSITQGDITVFRECIKVKKVFDEFVLRECVEGIEFEADEKCEGVRGWIEPTLILRDGKIIDPRIKDASKYKGCASNGLAGERRLRFSGKCCFKVFARDSRGNIIRLKVKNVPSGNALSKGPDGELCFDFSVRRLYPGASAETFERLLHFVDQEAFELQCLAEAIIDEENNEINNGILLTNVGIFVAIKFDAEVQLCIPVFGYCEITDE